MTVESEQNMIVGFSGVVLLGYTLLLIGIHMFIPHPSATKKVITLSYVSLILFTLAQSAIVGTYFIPHISGACICHGLWASATIFYICGLYTLKFVYIERICILNKHPMLASERIANWIKIVKYSLVVSCVVCMILMATSTEGECHEDLSRYGCKPGFHVVNAYIGIFMILVDAALFAGFCYKWWGLIRVFKLSSDSKILVEMIQSFSIQFVLTVIAMASCVVDIFINLFRPDYSTLIVFCFDAAVVASCNFAMIKESQAFMWKYLCWPCKIPSFLLRGTPQEVPLNDVGKDGKNKKNKRAKVTAVPSRTTNTTFDGSKTVPSDELEVNQKDATPEPNLNSDGEIVYDKEVKSADDHDDEENEAEANVPSMIIPSTNMNTNNLAIDPANTSHVVDVDDTETPTVTA